MIMEVFWGRFIYDRLTTRFYDVIWRKRALVSDMMRSTRLSRKEINEVICNWEIPSYERIVKKFWH